MRVYPDVRTPARRLRERRRLSYGDRNSANLLIQGENAAVLAALLDRYAGAVRCAYIDPPYNNQEHYNHYSDAATPDEWADALATRIELLHPLLRPDGSLWVSIDDTSVHHLRAMLDRIFGVRNFVATIVWQHRTTRENRRAFSHSHEYIVVYARDANIFRRSRNLLPPTEEIRARYKNPDRDPRGPWQSVSLNVQDGHGTPAQFYPIVAPSGRRHWPPRGRCWAFPEGRMAQVIADGRVWWGRDGNGVPRLKKFWAESEVGVTPETFWSASVAGTTLGAKRHLLALFPDQLVFDTPKPEALLSRVIHIASDPGDLVIDAYLGSGTFAAVAHKMGRAWIGIERGDHAVSLCRERLKRVVDGDGTGMSDELEWTPGGGFRFMSLA